LRIQKRNRSVHDQNGVGRYVIHDQVGEIRRRFWIDFQSLFDLPQATAYGGRQSELNPTNDATI
jgi:hypothetical protein